MLMTCTRVQIALFCIVVAGASTLATAEAGARARASIRADGTLMINGKSVLPIGIRIEGEGEEFAKLADVGFNTLLGSGAVGHEYYEAAARYGLWVIGGHYDWAHFESLSRGNEHGVDFYAGDIAGLTKAFGYGNQSGQTPLEVIDTFDHYPTVFAWNTCEEPTAKYVEPLEQMYAIFKANSPDHLVVTLLTHPDWYHTFKNAGDVTIVDVYPYRGAGSLPAILSYQYVRRAIEETGKPVWLMPQLYHGFYFSKNPADELTLQQIRQASYLGLIGGAKGVIFYSYYAYEAIASGDTRDKSAVLQERWTNLKVAVTELRHLSPLVCDGRPVELHIPWKTQDGVDAGLNPVRTFEYYGDYYVMVANVTSRPINGTIETLERADPNGFELSIFAGGSDLQVAQAQGPDNPAVVTVQPNGAGVVKLERRPLRPGDFPR